MPKKYEMQQIGANHNLSFQTDPDDVKPDAVFASTVNGSHDLNCNAITVTTEQDLPETEIQDQTGDLSKYDQTTQDDLEDLERPQDSKLFNCINTASSAAKKVLSHRITKYVIVQVAALAYIAYIGVCVWHFVRSSSTATDADKEASRRLFWISGFAFVWVVLHYLRKYLPAPNCCNLTKLSESCTNLTSKQGGMLMYIWYIVQLLIIVGFVIWVAVTRSENLISLAGMAVLLLIAFLSSRDHAMIDIRPVLGGIVLQLVFAVLVLRTEWGYDLFDFMGKRVQEFLVHCDAGSEFVFGSAFRNHFFAFSVLPIVIFFSSIVSILFHWGILSYIIEKIGFVMQVLLGTSPTESLVAAANIFIGMTEAPLMIAPFLKAMTNAEIHSIMTSGFATIAGSVLAAYVGMGVSARHLLGASVMSAPAALAVSKLMYPETKKSVISTEVARKVKLEKHSNFVEAAGVGAMNAVKLVAAIATTILAFISILTFLNSTLTWLGYRAGLEVKLTFELVTAYALWPLAFVMGVASRDCLAVAELIGIKTFVNEFVAYERLSKMQKNYDIFMNVTLNGTLSHYNIGTDIIVPAANATITGGVLFDERSILIATYSLCGFSNLGSIGILIGALSAMAPNRRRDIVDCVISAMIGGTIACFLTACIAGLFFVSTPGFR